MQYVANPVVVTAYEIIKVGHPIIDKGYELFLDNGTSVVATTDMIARMMPTVGDYWVIQEDGYTYLNPREVFERKYSPVK